MWKMLKHILGIEYIEGSEKAREHERLMKLSIGIRENPCTCMEVVGRGGLVRHRDCAYCKADWKEQLRMRFEKYKEVHGDKGTKENFLKERWTRAHISLNDSETEGTVAWYFKRDGFVTMEETSEGKMRVTNDDE